MTAGPVQQAMEQKLKATFAPESLEVVNESHLHAGHHHTADGHTAEFDGTGETHFRVRITSAKFAGMNRVERHRALNEVLAAELQASVHALALEPKAPGEAGRR